MRISDEIKEAMAGREFESLDEMNAFLTEFTRARNQTPKDDFHGLSPAQYVDGYYQLRCLNHFSTFLGLIEAEIDDTFLRRIVRLKKTPLLDDVLRFHV